MIGIHSYFGKYNKQKAVMNYFALTVTAQGMGSPLWGDAL